MGKQGDAGDGKTQAAADKMHGVGTGAGNAWIVAFSNMRVLPSHFQNVT